MTNWFIEALQEDVFLHKCAYCNKIIWWRQNKRRNRFKHNIWTHSKGFWHMEKWPLQFQEDDNSCTTRYVDEVVYGEGEDKP